MNFAEVTAGLPGAGTTARLHRRVSGAFDVDEWGLDPELVGLVDPLLALRWDIDVVGAEQLPAVGGAVLVFSRRVGVSEPWVLARGIRQATGRFVRTVGVPDVAPVGPVLRRFGGVLDRADEIAGLLRAGQLVGVPMARSLRGRSQAGALEVERLEAAIATGSPVVPVAVLGREVGRSWRLVLGDAVRPGTGGPLDAAELADTTRRAVQHLIDDAVPPSWWR